MKKLFRKFAGYIRHTDLLLLGFVLVASGLSVACLAGMAYAGYVDEPENFPYRTAVVQAAAAVCGFIGAVILSKIDYHTLGKLWKLHLPLCVAVVLLTFTRFGLTVGDADDQAWLPMLGGLSLQPTELLKVSFILTFAWHLCHVSERMNELGQTILLGIHAGSLILLVHFQGDDGTALVFVFIFLSMMISAGWSWWYITAGGAAVLLGTPLIWSMMNDSQRGRIEAVYGFGNGAANAEDILYQQMNALQAIGSGQLTGFGLLSPAENIHVPVIRYDFIFAYIGRALGFMGCLGVILLLTFICMRILTTCGVALDDMGRTICVGVFAMIAFQAIINIGMNLKLLPVIGITLPFISAGGTSVLSVYLGIGIVLSVRMHSRRNLFLDS